MESIWPCARVFLEPSVTKTETDRKSLAVLPGAKQAQESTIWAKNYRDQFQIDLV